MINTQRQKVAYQDSGQGIKNGHIHNYLPPKWVPNRHKNIYIKSNTQREYRTREICSITKSVVQERNSTGVSLKLLLTPHPLSVSQIIGLHQHL